MPHTYVIVTHNRCHVLKDTLTQLRRLDEPGGPAAPIIVVDNASTDGTAAMIQACFPPQSASADHQRQSAITLIRSEQNLGSFARNLAADRADTPYLVMLDDDSFPEPGTVPRAIGHMESSPGTGLVGGKVTLPDGQGDAAALPIVMPACAMVVRRDAFVQVGGFDRRFLRQAEEYDLIFKLLGAGWDVKRFENLRFVHRKVAAARVPRQILELDLRNNLVLLDRYMPRRWRAIYRSHWLKRYAAMLGQHDDPDAVARAVRQARQWIDQQRISEAQVRSRELSPALAQRVFQWQYQTDLVAHWTREHSIKRVLISDFSKNLPATIAAARACKLSIVAIADSSPAFQGMRYRAPALPVSLHGTDRHGRTAPTDRNNPADRAESDDHRNHRSDGNDRHHDDHRDDREHRIGPKDHVNLPVIADRAAIELDFDGVIVSNINPAQHEQRVAQWRDLVACPVLALWRGCEL